MEKSDISALMRGLAPVIRDHIVKHVSALNERIAALEARSSPDPVPGPPGERGEKGDPGEPGQKGDIGPEGRAGRDGKDIDPEFVANRIDQAVVKAVAAIPVPKDGISITLDDVRPLVEETVSRHVAALPAPKDAVGMAGALIDRGGNLVVTLTDGSTRELGAVVGRDGKPGPKGPPGEAIKGDPGEKGDVGDPGPSGRDGFGFDDLEVLQENARKIVVRFARGSEVKEFPLVFPTMIYRGVYKDGDAYEIGDVVTWAGSLWHCDADTADRPGEGQKSWTLAAKRGRDGKDGIVKETGPNGPVRVGPGKKPDEPK